MSPDTSKPIFLHETVANDNAPSYQVWLWKAERFRWYHPDKWTDWQVVSTPPTHTRTNEVYRSINLVITPCTGIYITYTFETMMVSFLIKYKKRNKANQRRYYTCRQRVTWKTLEHYRQGKATKDKEQPKTQRLSHLHNLQHQVEFWLDRDIKKILMYIKKHTCKRYRDLFEVCVCVCVGGGGERERERERERGEKEREREISQVSMQ